VKRACDSLDLPTLGALRRSFTRQMESQMVTVVTGHRVKYPLTSFERVSGGTSGILERFPSASTFVVQRGRKAVIDKLDTFRTLMKVFARYLERTRL